MPICRKCKKDKKGRNGKKAAYLLFLSAIPFTWLLGVEFGLFIIGLGFYSLVAYNPQKFICEDCSVKSCPECNGTLESKNLCKKCNVVTCPFCGQHQTHDTSVSWPAAIGGVFLFSLAIILLLAGFMIAPWIFVVIIMFHFYYSSPKCMQCSERISTTHY